jgi:hypothetical protein
MLLALARAHGRVLVDVAPDRDVVELAREVVELRARVAALESVVFARAYTE